MKGCQLVLKIINRGVNLKCASGWIEQIGSDEISSASDSNNQTLKCLQRCERQMETPISSSSLFPVEFAFPQHQIFCLTLEKVNRICKDNHRAKIFEEAYNQKITCNDIIIASETVKICNNNNQPNHTMIKGNSKVAKFLFTYARNSMAALRVFIKDPYYLLIRRDEQMPMISLLANAGGLLGLCMGLSLVSIFEIFYHLLNFIFEKIKKI